MGLQPVPVLKTNNISYNRILLTMCTVIANFTDLLSGRYFTLCHLMFVVQREG